MNEFLYNLLVVKITCNLILKIEISYDIINYYLVSDPYSKQSLSLAIGHYL